jgi:photosystem II stability/assembly factor-like uncharacterized protein
MRSSNTRTHGILKVLLLPFLASSAPAAYAGPGVWTSGGPWGGNISALAIDPKNPAKLYVGTNGGIFRSTDFGGTWVPASNGLTSTSVLCLAIHPAIPTTLYAGTAYGGVFRSTDSGATWILASDGLPDIPSVYSLVSDPTAPATLYAGTDNGVFRSSDSGGVWTPARTGLLNGVVNALAIDPTTSSTLYAGTAAGVFRSADSGGTWTFASKGLPNEYVNALALNPSGPSTLYVGTVSGGLFKSTDSGANWSPAGTELANQHVATLAIDPLIPSTLYAGTREGGVFRSFDSGGSWAAANRGLPGQPVKALAIPDSSPSALYAGTGGGGVLKSIDSGTSWAAANTGLRNQRVRALVISPSNHSTVFAGTYDSGVFMSPDSGGTWFPASTGLTNLEVHALAISQALPETLYAGTYRGVFKSTDHGGTWVSANMGLPGWDISALATDASTPSTLYAGSTFHGVFKSMDSGNTWIPANTGLATRTVVSLVIDPSNPSTLYAGTDLHGVFKSSDSGNTWVPAITGLPQLPPPYRPALAIDPANPSTLYAGLFNGGFFKSTDSGGTWVRASAGLTDLGVRALAIDLSNPHTVYAGTGSGVFRSTDSGRTWTAASTGLPKQPVDALALDASGATTLYAGLALGSVWQSTPATSPTVGLLPSTARSQGLGGAFYTTDLTVANTGFTPTTFVLKFLGNNGDGRGGPEKTFSIAAGSSHTLSDVLGSVFEKSSGFGAIRVTSPSDFIRALAQTSTPGFGGTFGQSVSAARPEDLIVAGTPRSILAVREDASFRTNLILANATEAPLDVDVTLVSDTGPSPPSASRRFTLPPLGMTQVTRVVRELGVTADVSGARLVVSTPSSSGSFAAYASVIDNVTNDPRTLLPIGPIVSGWPSPDYWLLPSSARASGAGGAFYTTDLTVAYTNDVSARYTLSFLGHDKDGRGATGTTFDLGAGKSATYADVLGSVFHKTSDYGAIRISSQYPYSDAGFLAVLAQTSTPGFGGTFGQSVPAATAADLIRSGTERSILAVREDDAFRTNLILANATGVTLDVDVRLVSADGADLATKRYSLAPLGMTQVTKVVRDVGIAASVAGARLVLSTLTANGAFAAYASVIDNVTNDPRTLLPR